MSSEACWDNFWNLFLVYERAQQVAHLHVDIAFAEGSARDLGGQFGNERNRFNLERHNPLLGLVAVYSSLHQFHTFITLV